MRNCFFAIKIANGFKDRLQQQPGEHTADTINGCLGVALKRASLFSRAPVVHDLTVAFTIWGFLDATPPPELVASRNPPANSSARQDWPTAD